MALTKVTGQVIKNTTDVTVGVLTVTNTLAVGGTVSIGGTLTYEDVTNVDAVGLITARNGIVVGSGITLSKDGDIFATGISTVKGIHINGTQLGEDLKVGTGVTITRDGNIFATGITTITNAGSNNGNLIVDGSLQFFTNSNTVGIVSRRSNNGANFFVNDSASSSQIRTIDGRLHIGADTNDEHVDSEIRFLVDGNIRAQVSAGSSFMLANDNDTHFGHPANNSLSITNGGVETLRADSGNRILIGHTTNRQTRSGNASFSPNVQIESDSVAAMSMTRFHDGTAPSRFILQKGRGTIASPTVVQDGDAAGQILFSAWDGDTFTNTAEIRSEVDGTPGDDDMPGNLIFSTTPDGGSVRQERLRITSTGFVGLGYDSPSSPLHIVNQQNASIRLYDNTGAVGDLTSAGWLFKNLASNASPNGGGLVIYNGSTDVISVTPTGLVGVGEGDPDHHLHVNSGATNAVATFESTDAYASIFIKDSGTHATGTYFGVQSDHFRWVTHYGSSAERARLTSDGYFLVGTGSEKNLGQGNTTTGVGLNPSGRVNVSRDGAASLLLNRNSSNGAIALFYREGLQKGNISVTGSAVAYNTTTSDRSTKKNFEPWTENTLELFKNINPQKFNFIHQEDSEDKIKGYVAQDLVDSFPEAYPKDDDGKYHFNPSGMVVYLMKALQEATIKIETLETEVSALKGG